MFRNSLYNPVSHLLLIILLCLLAYSNTFHSPFTFDDMGNIIENNRIKDISNIPSFFTDIEGQPIMARPLTAVTFAVNYHFGKLDTTGYHIFNLALHITNGILLFFLIKITAGYLNYKDEKTTGLIALFSSLIFTVHPIQTESVTYVVTRSVLLSTFFFLLGIMLFTKAVGTEGKRKLSYTLALFITCLLGMASREEFFIFPVMLILYDLYFISKQDIRRVFKNYQIHLPVILTLAYVIFIVMSFDYEDHAGFGVKTITPLEYLMTQFNVHWTYLRLLFFPVNQNLDYDYPIAKVLFELPTILSFIGYIGLWAAGIYLYKKKPVISFCILWFMVALAPSSSMMPIMDVIFEHRLYLPSVGFFIALTAAIAAGRERWENSTIYAKKADVYGMILVMLVLSVATYARNSVWENNVRLWENAVKGSSDKARPHFDLGNAYFAQNRIDEAINEYRAAQKLFLNPYAQPLSYADIHYNLGNAYYAQGRFNEAINEYSTALKFNRNFVKSFNNLGDAYLAQGRFDEAINEYRAALKLNPDHYSAHNNLGIAYLAQGRIDEAINEYRAALKLNPDDVMVRKSLETLLKR